MRHGKKFNHLSRTDSHRRALLSSLATSLIVHKRINTTVAKAKALRVYVEPLLTKSKTDSTHSRRQVFSYLQDKNSVNILFRDVASKIAERNGGYTRIIKTGTRLGDNAEMCFIELVDYNLLYTAKTETKKAKTTRRGRSTGTGTTSINAPIEIKESKSLVSDVKQGKHSESVKKVTKPEIPVIESVIPAIESESLIANPVNEKIEPESAKPEPGNLEAESEITSQEDHIDTHKPSPDASSDQSTEK